MGEIKMENEHITKHDKQYTENDFCIEFDAISENEGLARVVIAAFISRADPTLDELEDVKTAVSEAVTNAIIHGYREQGGRVVMRAHLTEENELSVEIIDRGVGIADVAQAMQPLYTSAAENERSGMGFSFMEAFMDDLEVESEAGCGTLVRMCKKIGVSSWIDSEE